MSYDKNPKTVFGNRIFQNVYPQDIKINVNSKNFIEVSKGEIIYQLGDNSDSLYLLLKGQVKIKVYDSVGGTSLIKKFADDFFGENELLEKTPRKSTAIAMEKSLVYFIDGNELSELTKNKTICANLFNSTSAIRSANQKSFDKPPSKYPQLQQGARGLGGIGSQCFGYDDSVQKYLATQSYFSLPLVNL